MFGKNQYSSETSLLFVDEICLAQGKQKVSLACVDLNSAGKMSTCGRPEFWSFLLLAPISIATCKTRERKITAEGAMRFGMLNVAQFQTYLLETVLLDNHCNSWFVYVIIGVTQDQVV